MRLFKNAFPETKDAVDRYITDMLVHEDPRLKAVTRANRHAGLPPIDLSPLEGKLLEVLVQIAQPRHILEVGTLGGYSTLWMARALPAGGQIVTLEIDPRHAELARRNLENSGVQDRVEIRVGPALQTLPKLAAEGRGPFDMVFIDADKENYRPYLDWAIRLSRPGTVIVADNMVQYGRIADARTTDAEVRGVRQMFELMATEPRLSSVAIPTLTSRGYDGFALAVVLE